MAADLAGTAAIRLVPSLAGFRARAQTELQRQKGLAVDVDIRPRVDTSTASRQLERFRAKEQADAINLKAKIDEADFKRQFQRVEHVFERSAFAKAFRLQIKVVGADALYAVATAAASAAAALDTVAKSAVILPGALSAAGVAAGVFALALSDVKKAITSVQTEQDQAADKARALASAQRDSADAQKDVQRAHEGVSRSVKQAIRDYEDLEHAVRGTSLSEADALLNIQESYDRLRAGGQKSLTELRRDQLSYLQDLHRLDEVRTSNKRTLEDYQDAQRKGLSGNDQVVAALDAVTQAQNRVADAASRMADATQTKTMTGAYARLAPAAKEFVDAITNAKGAWVELGAAMQQGVFEGQARNLNDTLNALRGMRPELEGVAHQIGGVFLDMGQILRRGDIQGQLKGIVSSTGSTIGTLRQGLDPLISGFIRMADVGARHLPQLIDVFNRLFERFDAFTQKAAADGTLDRWIDQGIRGFESLLHVGENIVGIVSDVANAWRLAGGESTGLIQNAEDLTNWIRSWTSSQTGQNSMAEQFRAARSWLGQMADALHDIWPTLQSIVQTVREWSALFLTVLGWAARLTSWVNDHTGLVTVMVGAYLTIRTVKPIWDTLTNAGQMYTNMLMKAAAMNQTWAQNAVSNLAQAQTAMGKTGTSAQTLASTFGASSTSITSNMRQVGGASGQLAQGPIARLQSAFMGMITPVNSTAAQIRSLNGFIPPASNNMQVMATSAGTAATAVGKSAASGLWGAAAGLAGFLGPMAIAMVATGGIIWAIDKMGEAHRRAAAEAQNQENILKSLKTTLDSFTGSFTAQTAQQTATQLQGYDIPGLGKRNILQDIARTGVATPEQFIGATNPVNQQQRQDILSRLDAQTKGSIEGSDVWRRYHEVWERNGVDINTMTLAANGDKGAMDKVHSAERAMFNDVKGREVFDPTGAYKKGQIALGRAAPSVTDTLQSAGVPSSTTAAIALRDVSGAMTSQGQQTQASTQAAFGTGVLKPSAAGSYPPGSTVTMSGPDTAIVTSAGPVGPDFIKNFPADVGTVQPLPDGRVQIQLTREAFLRDIEKKADGGMIRGVGSGTSDSNLIAASRGEYIVRKAAVDAVGVHNLDRINSMRFEGGGIVGGIPFPLKPPAPVPPIPIPGLPGGPAPAAPPQSWTDLMLPPGSRPAAPPAGVPAPPTTGTFNTTPPPITPAPAPYAPTAPPPATPAPDTGTPHLPDATAATPTVPSQYPAGTPPTTSIPFSPNMVTGIPGVTPGQPYGLPAGTDIRQGAAGFPDWVYQVGNSFGVDASTYAGHQESSGQNQGIDWWPKGKSDMSGSSYTPEEATRMDQYAEWLGTQPGVEQVIWENPLTGKKVGFANGQRVGPGTNQPQYYANDWKDHLGHVHTRFSSSPGAPGMMPGMAMPGMPGVTVSPYGSTVSGFPGVPGMPGSGGYNDSNLSLSDRIAKRYEDALKPENVNKFLFGQAENVGQSMMAIGIQFLSGLTGLDIGSVYGPAQQIMQHFAGSGSSGSGDNSSLQAGSPMDQAISGDLSSFTSGTGAATAFDPMAGLNLSGLASGIAANGVGGPGITNADAASLQQLAQQLLQRAGFPLSEWPPFKNIVDNESSWNPTARNASGAFGLGQFLGHENDQYGQMGAYTTDPVKQLSAMLQYIKDRYGTPTAAWQHWQANHSYATGGLVPARVSRGEYRMSPKAVQHYGPGFMHAINSFAKGGQTWDPRYENTPKNKGPASLSPWFDSAGGGSPWWGIFHPGPANSPYTPPWGPQNPFSPLPGMGRNPIQMLGGFAGGGMPFLPQGVVLPKPPPPAPLPSGPAAMPKAIGPAPGTGPGANQNGPVAPVGPPPAPGVPAPAPGPGGSIPVGPPPGATPAPPSGMVDPNVQQQQQAMGQLGAVGPAPTTNTHLAQGVKGAIEGGFNAAGQAMATAASIAGGMGMPGASGAGSLMQGGMQLAGQFASGLANVAASAGVGTISQIGTQATPSGAPLLPAIAPTSFQPLQTPDQIAAGAPVTQGNMPRGPAIVNNYFGGIHTQNMDEWQRRQQLLERQQEQPLTNALVH